MAEAPAKVEKDPLVGRVINDRFKILELVARGGMGRVFKAQQAPLGRVVALKVLDPRYKGEEDPEFQARFFLEASTAAKLSHPNTVTVFDYGKTSDDIYFIVMEFVEGRTLSSLLKTGGAMDPLRAINIA
ncbi:MAG TPA: protein kinase, partial [Polyangiaceae bacterium LLY-WYZ-15_(1-7)]|nr:protein kinase [Polyangiaceae bacterium LLY-WYZ-15_(1-7)]